MVDPTSLKEQVREYWNQQSCDTQVSKAEKFSKGYFEDIESFRYFDQPFIHSFAQFTRYRGKRVLEVGFGAGTDFIQWLRAGAIATGVDLTQEALENLTHRIQVYDLPPPEKIMVTDAENLPFASETFDLGYSFGVLHHTPNTEKAVAELVRVIKPGGEIKIMLYNRHSIGMFNLWLKHGLLKGCPWKSFTEVLGKHLESAGTKAYTRKELRALLERLGLKNGHIHTEITSGDYLSASAFPPLNLLYRAAIKLTGEHFGWHPSQFVSRINEVAKKPAEAKPKSAESILLTGNRVGFYHCISARKPR